MNGDFPDYRNIIKIIDEEFFVVVDRVKFLNSNGKLIAITPRSFCNGLYFKVFRKFYLSEVDFTHFHHFLTRDQLFKKDIGKME